MGREAIFRAYHPRYGMSKPFRPFVDMLVMFDTFSGTGVARVQNHTVASNPELTWMQSTELEDKNGRIIFAGDIVVFHAFRNGGGVGGYSEVDYYGEGVVYYEPLSMSWMFLVDKGDNEQIWDIHGTSHYEGEECIEVVGNTHEGKCV